MRQKAAKQTCPEFPFFGAVYPDARCVDGYLWDLDSCKVPGGPLYKGGDDPCPFCNHAEVVRRIADYLWESSDGMTKKAATAEARKRLKAFRERHGY
jgi:hypothetical protein